MRGKAIGKEWYKDDYNSGNKVYIEINVIDFNGYEHEMENIYNIIMNEYLEYMYIKFINDASQYHILAKWKGINCL